MGTSSPRTLAGRYRLGDPLGSGGFGTVFEAEDCDLRRRVAVKLLDPRKTESSEPAVGKLRDRFQREAVATAAIVHPNVVTVFDVGIDGEEIFIVMELLSGRTLSEELEHFPTGISPERALPLFIGALEGLAAGHEAGIVHKDLKPNNLFLTTGVVAGERLRIIDFGVARILHEERLTATGKLVGSPRYLAPEYIEHLTVTAALDVYQMGLILVEMLCAVPCVPRRLGLVSCCQRHVDGQLAIPVGLRGGEIGAVIARALALSPTDRYAHAGEFARALAAIDPLSVSTVDAAKARPTPRLGVKPLTTGPTPGHRSADRPAAAVEPKSARRHKRTAPTKRLGLARDIAEQLVAPAETEEPPPIEQQPAEPAPPRVEVGPLVSMSMDADESLEDLDPMQKRRMTIYAIIALAAAVLGITIAFFVMRS